MDTSEDTIISNIFHFPYMDDEKCERLSSIILKNQQESPHNGSMQKYTTDIYKVSPDIIHTIVDNLIPKINSLYDFDKKQEYYIYNSHGIIYKTNGSGEKKLNLHVDDSDITINITLNTDNLKGNILRFHGITEYGNIFCKKNFERIQNTQIYSKTDILPIKGDCIIHRGSHPHETLPIEDGMRIALIIWLKKKYSIDENKKY